MPGTGADEPDHRTRRTPPGRIGPADVLGVPALPPGRVAVLGNRARAGLARAHRATAPPPARVMEAVLGGLDPAALAALCRLDVPDRLVRPTACADLASELGVDASRLARLLRYAAARGWVRIDRRGRVRPTRVTAFLRRDHPGGWRAWVEFAAGDEVTAAIGRLDAGLPADGDAFATANGTSFFAWMQDHPDRHTAFDAAMAAGGRMHGLIVAHALDWSASRRVCDIGGGDGALLGVLLAQHPHLEGVLLELPEVVDRAPERPNVTAVAGDAFDTVPPGCDTYLLVNVLHDWDDEAAVRLLRRAAEAAAAEPSATDPRIVIVDSEAQDRPRDDLATRADLLMLALTPGGRERTTDQFAALASAAGLRLHRTHDLPTGDVAHVLVADR
ncbi:methyltransferase [Nitriliruptor alkaliphilus]|uniref:methyltransferase n=1 Tax=Nitriliruptor alkaliphilus TaxID=427918 RepID=UPI0006987425|nr:methyltransferase [Nitriliruptor alkaliphilus]